MMLDQKQLAEIIERSNHPTFRTLETTFDEDLPALIREVQVLQTIVFARKLNETRDLPSEKSNAGMGEGDVGEHSSGEISGGQESDLPLREGEGDRAETADVPYTTSDTGGDREGKETDS